MRSEALFGLAKRHDSAVVEPLYNELTSSEIGKLVIRAAKEIGNQRQIKALIALRSWWDVDTTLLEEAISASLPKK